MNTQSLPLVLAALFACLLFAGCGRQQTDSARERSDLTERESVREVPSVAPPTSRDAGRLVMSPKTSPLGSPHLFADRDDFLQINQLASSDEDFAQARNAILSDADKARHALSRPLPNHLSARGSFPVAGYNYSSLAGALRDLGLAWALTDDESYARPAIRAFLAYARGYKPGWTSSLGESGWLIQLAWAYDLLHNAMDAREAEAIRDLLTASAYSTLQGGRGGMNWQARINAAVGLVGIALDDEELLLLAIHGEEEAAQQSLRGREPDLMGYLNHGYLDHIAYSLRSDGMWFEQSMSYHYLALQYLCLLAEAAHRKGIPLYDWGDQGLSLKNALLAPLYHAYSDGSQAPYGDSDPELLIPNWISWYYGLAASRYEEHQLLRLWQQATPRLARDSRYPRLFVLYALHQSGLDTATAPPLDIGTGAFAPGGYNLFGNTLLGGLGMGVLRGGPLREASCLEATMVYKPYGTLANHQQADNLGIEIITAGHRWIPNIGKVGAYGEKLHQEWGIHTLASNTIVVDRTSQLPQGATSNQRHTRDPGAQASSGQLGAFSASPGFAYLSASTDQVYPGVVLQRHLINAGGYILDYSRADSASVRTYDWVSRINGELGWSSAPVVDTKIRSLGQASGYQHLHDLREVVTQGNTWGTLWSHDEQRLALRLITPRDSQIYLARSPASGRHDLPTVVMRHEGKSAEFVALYAPLEAGESPARIQLQELTRLPGEALHALISHPNASSEREVQDTVIISGAEETVTHADITFRGAAMVMRQREGKIQDLLLADTRHFHLGDLGILSPDHPASLSWYPLGEGVGLLTVGLGPDDVEGAFMIHLQLPSFEDPAVYQLKEEGREPTPISTSVEGGYLALEVSPLTHYLIASQGQALPQVPNLSLTLQSR